MFLKPADFDMENGLEKKKKKCPLKKFIYSGNFKTGKDNF